MPSQASRGGIVGATRRKPAQDALRRPVPEAPDDCRCRCGSLVARIVSEGVEIKCRRCKRDLLVPWSARDAWVRPVEMGEPLSTLHGDPS